jgi:hypothetical protein
MPSTASNSSSGNAYINGILYPVKWATTSLTYSFPTAASQYGSGYPNGEPGNGFEAFTATQQNAIREILKSYSAVSGLKFTEVSAASGDLRYAESDATGTAWAYLPTTHVVGGDAWFNNSKNMFDSPQMGNYAWIAMIHETGHALGLKHPQDAAGAFAAMPGDKDSMEYTVMSYRSYVGAGFGFTNGSASFAHTLMMYDIAAIQYMYGANYTTNAGDTVYTWSPTTGQMFVNGAGQTMPAGNKILMTVWDGGGNDTYDFSNYSGGVKVDLNPGGWTTTAAAQLANLSSSKVAVGNIANALLYNNNAASLIENAVGTNSADTISGNSANNMLTGRGGNDVLDGRDGYDTAAYSGASSDYSWVQQSDGSWKITDLRSGNPDGVDTLKNMEALKFIDQTVALGSSTPPPNPPTDPNPDPDPNPPTGNVAPTANNDSYTVARNKVLKVTKANGLLANDSDANGDAMTVSLVSTTNKGKVQLAKDGSFTFTPSKNFVGTATFTYKVSDGKAVSSTATVTIRVGVSSYGSTKDNGAAGYHDASEDQYPIAIGPQSTVSGQQIATIAKVLAASGVVSISDGMLDQILSVVAGLGSSHVHEHFAPADVVADASSLPDFLGAFSSEFALF